jgi:phenylpropionate dioxygenase-like ring-hydroxylating dioxygenase large terminal subunit
MATTTHLADDPTVVQRIFDHIDKRTTDLGEGTWREPVEHYRSAARFALERERVLRRYPTAFCPSAALPEAGSYVAREAAGTPLVAVRGTDGVARVFRNACRHRGTQLVDGVGCEKAFVCPYHAWTYGLDGRLRHVPHAYGFPGLDTGERGLVPVETVEANGLVFVTQGPPVVVDASPGALPPLIPSTFGFLGAGDVEMPANWKIVVEGFLEGYHIRSTHPHTFYPLQFDNLNVVEGFGRNSRIAFPFRAVDKLRSVPPAERSADGKLTYVYHLFPNVMVATFPGRIFMVAVEPVAVDRTRLVTYVLSDRTWSDPEAQSRLERGQDLVGRGGAEDRDVACAIQRGLASGANAFFEFGLFEEAIGRFHRALHELIDAAPAGVA